MKKYLFFALLILVFTSCETALEKYYQTPGWLKGNAWEVLEDRGDFDLFLQAVERTSYKDLVQGKGVITVMAPTDEAFQNYLHTHNYDSIGQIPLSELEKLIAYHLVYYSFSKTAFEDYKPEGISSENDLKGVYYKFRTKSRDEISEWADPTEGGLIKKVMHKERFLPVFSHNLFESYEIDAKSNYEYFFPASEWTGNDGFNVSNASVIDYAIVTDNGYVYTLDKVLEPLETVYTSLSNSDGFDLFRSAYDRFVSFDYDANASAEYGEGDSLFIRSHGYDLPAIASEWTNLQMGVDYTQLSILSRRAYNLFAPDDVALSQFFQEYWSPFYSSLDEVNFIPLLALLTNHVSGGDILFPQIIENGTVKSPLGTPIVFDRNDAKVRQMCVNGSFYGLNKVLVPTLFTQVTKPMFVNPNYTIFLDMMVSSNLINSLLSDQVQFKIFYPSDSLIELNTTLEGRMIKYVNTNKLKYGSQSLQIEGDLGLEDMKFTQKKVFAGSHVATKKIFETGDTTVYATMNDFNYLFTISDKVYSSSIYNSGDPLKVPTYSKIADYPNGEAYSIVGASASALVPETNQLKSIFTSIAAPADFEYFKALISAAGMDKTLPPYNFLLGERFIVFVPSNATILAGFAAGKIPFSPADKVAQFLKPYFVNVSESGLLDYPFPGTGVNTELLSFGTNSTGDRVKFTIEDKGNYLVIKDKKGNEVKVSSVLPRIYADGAAYIIDGLLEVE